MPRNQLNNSLNRLSLATAAPLPDTFCRGGIQLDPKSSLFYMMAMIPGPDRTTERHYVWAPRKELAFIQSLVDAYDGITRIRTEKNEGERSMLLFMVPPSQRSNFDDFLRQLKEEIKGSIDIV